MINLSNDLQEFGDFRIDVENRFLWHRDEPVDLPPKALELLCVLAEKSGQVVTKDQIWESVWQNSCVEETNLTHNIYLLRKLFKQYGEDSLIQTVPRRGYRFTADMRTPAERSVITEHSFVTRTLIEELPAAVRKRSFLPAAAVAVVLVGLLSVSAYLIQVRSGLLPYLSLRSIAVLPFANLGDTSADNDNLSIGITDLLITRLTNLKSLRVRPTSSIMGSLPTDPIAAGKELKVDAVIEGTILRTADKVRITVRLVDVANGTLIWAREMERPSGEEYKFQKDLAFQIADALRVDLSRDEQAALTKDYTANQDAYELYTQGRFEWNKRSWPGMIEAQRLFRNAIAADPKFALAYSGLADTIATGRDHQGAAAAVEKALEIDPNLAEAHATKGFIDLFHKWEWDSAEASLKRSIELNPNYAAAHHWLGLLHSVRGRHSEAIAELNIALEINPLSYNYLADLGQIQYFARDYSVRRPTASRRLS